MDQNIMTAIADLSSARAKLRRAKEHQCALKAEIDVWIKQSANICPFHIGSDGVWHTIAIGPIHKPDELRLAVVAGDIIQNLRSALDHLIWQLVLRDGQNPSRSNQFPIFEDGDKFMQEVKFRKKSPERSMLHGITDRDVWAIIEAAQPYNCSPVYASPLRSISRLSNRDKHRTLCMFGCFPSEKISSIVYWNPEAILLERCLHAGPLSFKDPTEIVRYRFADQLDPGMNMNGDITIFPCFGEPEIEGAVQLSVGAFSDLIGKVTSIINDIRRLPRVEN